MPKWHENDGPIGLKRRHLLALMALAASGIGLLPVRASAEVPQIVKDIRPGASGSLRLSDGTVTFHLFVDLGRMVLFAANDGTNGMELWRSDGAEAGTFMIKDIFPGSGSSDPLSRLGRGGNGLGIVVAGTLFFIADDGASGRELWRSDGTGAGTFRVKDICPGSCNSSAESLVEFDGALVFSAFDGMRQSLWRSDGTEAGTLPVVNRVPQDPFRQLVSAGGLLFFSDHTGFSSASQELFRSDGTEAGTYMVKDIRPGEGGSAPDSLFAVGGTLFFRADDGSGRGLWRSDGTAGGTSLVKRVITDGPDGRVQCGTTPLSHLAEVGGTVFFRAFEAATGSELWRSDGTEAGTYLVKDVFPGSDSSRPDCLVAAGGALFFRAADGTTGGELWRSDGTEAGTFMVEDILPGLGSSNPNFLVDARRTLFFGATGAGGTELWRSDGTEAGTVLVTDISPGTGHSFPQSLLVAGGGLFFSADDGTRGREPWMLALASDPIADAGPDQTAAEGSAVTLDATASTDPNGDPVSYLWEQVGGPSVTLSDASAAQPSFTAPGVPNGGATLTFRLTVSDGVHTSEPDTVDVTVTNVNRPPVADAGDDQMVQEGSAVTLQAGDSFDPDSEPLTYEWTQTAGAAVSLSDPAAAEPAFAAPLVSLAGETLVFTLTVSDGAAQSTDEVVVVVTNVNQVPIAEAGSDQTINEGSAVTLQGSGSSDPDGDALAYAWVQVSGPPVVLSAPASARPTFTAPNVGPGGDALVFELVVSDSSTASPPDTVTITVRDSNQPPSCEQARASRRLLWPPNHKLLPISVVGVADPEDRDVTITITAVTQDEPVNGHGDGDTSPDAVLQGASVLLRAERSGCGTGRVYAVAFEAEDANGAVCTGRAVVCVPHDRRGGVCVDEGQRYDSLLP